ncbi:MULTISPECIES: UbiX family flavin prenyltransferase [unclassified Achromobacter]|uniref:UbiX family flavin prenyltransferase n=1 Tax=unclassified Achromobacter TaxID=2626865 RepID=UPI000B5151FE|nr:MULTISPECIES: UbiX family flavin prenyltransferase [unclassified Achromobacter]OWT80057.1 3-octaprenyl-4-hydroxybenzoate carboxy-lyase [Achromobacter sp. HZ34]OWT81940.1 3-octaprenyl-4-hydroxybenzoate carboxy-lyase [Achromobacter sp. HZ28]
MSVAGRKRLIVAITGASGSIYGVRILRELRCHPEWESHLVLSASGALTAAQELALKRTEIEALADVVHNVKDVGAAISSGSFPTEGMVIAPCSMKTLAAVALGMGDNLVSRAADVALKERRRVVLLARETPLNLAHLRNMTSVTEMGGIIFPPVPAFYNLPSSLDDVINHTVGRVLDLFGVHHEHLLERWQGLRKPQAAPEP